MGSSPTEHLDYLILGLEDSLDTRGSLSILSNKDDLQYLSIFSPSELEIWHSFLKRIYNNFLSLCHSWSWFSGWMDSTSQPLYIEVECYPVHELDLMNINYPTFPRTFIHRWWCSQVSMLNPKTLECAYLIFTAFDIIKIAWMFYKKTDCLNVTFHQLWKDFQHHVNSLI